MGRGPLELRGGLTSRPCRGLITEKDPDVPVVWTNTKYKMLYMNMGHGDKVFNSPTQNKLFENGILWLLGRN